MPDAPLRRWLRSLARWWLGNQLRRGAASFLCLRCQQPVGSSLPLPLSDALWDSLVECDHCGHGMSVLALMAESTKTPEERIVEGVVPVEQPPGSRVVVEQAAASRTWHVPANGGCANLFVIGLVFLLMSSLGGIVAAWAWFNTGPRVEPFVVLWLVAIFVLLLGGGVWFIYMGLERMRASHAITVGPVEFVHERRFLGRVARKAWPRQDIRSVELVSFYTKDYKPVHGIEVRRGSSRIRFGSALTAMDKAWLCHDLRVALGLTAPPTPEEQTYAKAVMSRPFYPEPDPKGPRDLQVEQTNEGCTVTVPHGTGGRFFITMGALMAAGSAFMLWRGLKMWLPGRESLPAEIGASRDSFFLVWCTGVTLGLLIGLAIVRYGWRRRHTHQRVTASSNKVHFETQSGSSLRKESWDTAKVYDIVVEPAFSVLPTGRASGPFRAVIMLADRVHGFGLGYPRRDLESVAASLRAAMGRSQLGS